MTPVTSSLPIPHLV